jgi:hypothetical protein
VPPIISFELARSRADLQELFGPPGDCREQLERGLRSVNLYDYLFMLVYGGFLFFAVAASRRTPVARLAMAVVVLGVLADATENVCLLRLDLAAPEPWLLPLAIASRTKFVLLAFVSLVLGLQMLREERRVWRKLAPLQFLPVPALLALFDVRALGILTPAFAVSWILTIAWMGWKRA